MEYVLQTFDVVKKYKEQYALNHLNMNVAKGDIYGFVGENGSGKTTIIRLITGLIFADSGTFSLFGIPSSDIAIYEARKKIGAIVETPSIYLNMTAEENIRMQATLQDINDIDVNLILHEVGLEGQIGGKKKAGNFSLGMKQRLGIAMALIGNPELIILDEPMNGLDPAGIVGVRELILKLNKERGITFIISSHILTELALVATKYGIISKGKIIKEITNDELMKECKKTIFIYTKQCQELYDILSTSFDKNSISLDDGIVKLYNDISYDELLPIITENKIRIDNIVSHDIDIENYYLSVIGGKQNG